MTVFNLSDWVGKRVEREPANDNWQKDHTEAWLFAHAQTIRNTIEFMNYNLDKIKNGNVADAALNIEAWVATLAIFGHNYTQASGAHGGAYEQENW